MEIIISKLEEYPKEEPNSFAVGFLIKTNNRAFYLDTAIPFARAKTDELAIKLAYEDLANDIASKAIELEAKSDFLGKVVEVDNSNKVTNLKSQNEER
jgi:hypothetical protein